MLVCFVWGEVSFWLLPNGEIFGSDFLAFIPESGEITLLRELGKNGKKNANKNQNYIRIARSADPATGGIGEGYESVRARRRIEEGNDLGCATAGAGTN